MTGVGVAEAEVDVVAVTEAETVMDALTVRVMDVDGVRLLEALREALDEGETLALMVVDQVVLPLSVAEALALALTVALAETLVEVVTLPLTVLDQVAEPVNELETLLLPLSEALVEALADGVALALTEADQETLPERLGETEPLALAEADGEALLLADALAETELVVLADAESDALGVADGVTCGNVEGTSVAQRWAWGRRGARAQRRQQPGDAPRARQRWRAWCCRCRWARQTAGRWRGLRCCRCLRQKACQRPPRSRRRRGW